MQLFLWDFARFPWNSLDSDSDLFSTAQGSALLQVDVLLFHTYQPSVWIPTICCIGSLFCLIKRICFPCLFPVYSLLQFLPMGTNDLWSLPLSGLVHGAWMADAGLLSYLDPSYVCDKNASSPRQIYWGNSSVFLLLKNTVAGDCLVYFTLLFFFFFWLILYV